MSYAVPTVADLKARFPAFAAVADASVGFALVEAALWVDDTWIEADFAPAMLLYAAHTLQLEGFGPNAQEAMYQAGGLTSFSSGQLSATFANGGAGGSLLLTTVYGRRFLALQRRNHPAILTVNEAVT